MPKKRGKRYNLPTFKTKKEAERHGYIQYGKFKSGERKFRVYKTKGGWNCVKK